MTEPKLRAKVRALAAKARSLAEQLDGVKDASMESAANILGEVLMESHRYYWGVYRIYTLADGMSRMKETQP